MITKETYQQEMQAILACGGGTYYLVQSEHCRFLGGNGTAVLVLAFLLNLMRMKNGNPSDRKKLIENDMWFKCPASFIQKELGMWDKKQQTALAVLVDKKIIEKENRCGNVLWIRFNTDGLKAASSLQADKLNQLDDTAAADKLNQLDEKSGFNGTGKVGLTEPTLLSKHTNSTSKETHCPPTAAASEISSEPPLKKKVPNNGKAHQWAELLWNMVDRKGLLNRNRSRFTDWVKEFQLLQSKGPKEGAIPTDKEIEDNLKALLPHISETMDRKFWPVIHSANSFREKYHQLDLKVKKENKKNGVERASTVTYSSSIDEETGQTVHKARYEIPEDDDVRD